MNNNNIYREPDEPNRFYIGNLSKSRIVTGLFAGRKNLARAIFSLILLTIFLTLYGLVLRSPYEPLVLNPLKNFFRLGERPLLGVFIIALAALGGRLITKNITEIKTDPAGATVQSVPVPGSASKADRKEISEAFLYSVTPNIPGNIIGKDPVTQEIIFKPWETTDHKKGIRNNHTLLIGTSGGGKTACGIMPNVFAHIYNGNSLVVYDPKADIYIRSVQAAIEEGYEVYLIDLSKEGIKNSDGWDCFRPIKLSDDPERAAGIYAEAILMNADREFWNDNNKLLIKLAILFVTKARGFVPITTTMGRNETIVSDDKRTFSEFMAYIHKAELLKETIEAAMAKYPEDRLLLEEGYVTWTENTQWKQIASGLVSALQAFTPKSVREMLSHDDIHVEDLARKKAILYMVTPWEDSSLEPLTSLFFKLLIVEFVKEAKRYKDNRFERMIYLVLEEFPSIGYIPDFGVALSNLRSYNVGALICAQNVQRIMGIYNKKNDYEWIDILENCMTQVSYGAMISLGSKGMANAEYFEFMSGKQRVLETMSSEERSRFLSRELSRALNPTVRETTKQAEEPVFSSTDIRTKDGDELFVFSFGHNPFKCNGYYYEDHPLGKIFVEDKKTGAEIQLKPSMHIPRYKTEGKCILFDPERYRIARKQFLPAQSASSEKTSGVSYESLVRR